MQPMSETPTRPTARLDIDLPDGLTEEERAQFIGDHIATKQLELREAGEPEWFELHYAADDSIEPHIVYPDGSFGVLPPDDEGEA